MACRLGVIDDKDRRISSSLVQILVDRMTVARFLNDQGNGPVIAYFKGLCPSNSPRLSSPENLGAASRIKVDPDLASLTHLLFTA